MTKSAQYKRLLYEREVLWAVYEIRDHYNKRIVQEVYENIGQVLSLVRVQLSSLSLECNSGLSNSPDPGNLIGQAMQDLKRMCRALFPDVESLDKFGIIETLECELKLLGFTQAKEQIKVFGVPYSLDAKLELILFGILQEILISAAHEGKDQELFIDVFYDKEFIQFILRGASVPFVKPSPPTLGLNRLSVNKRAKLVGGQIVARTLKNNQKLIKLKVPFKTLLYE